MEAALQLESPAVEARERLVAFVGEVADGLSLARQRENALLYVRGLIEHGAAGQGLRGACGARAGLGSGKNNR